MRNSARFPVLKEARFVAASYERNQGRSLVSAYEHDVMMHEEKPEFALLLEPAVEG